MKLMPSHQQAVDPEDVEREIRALFTGFARKFHELPGASANDKASAYIASYIELYQQGHREARPRP